VSEGKTIEEARAMVLDALQELTACRREMAMKTTTVPNGFFAQF
jgi:predicted RNase H-like HicB family nuclease